MNPAGRIERLWWREAPPPAWLRAISRLYRAVSRRHLAHRAARAIAPPVPLISVGNITVGGSGKTPFVIWLCEELARRDYRPVILCRGDGGRLRDPRQVRPDDDASEVGDEALLLARSSGCPVVAGRDRVAGARLAAECGDVIVLDDGFQYRQLMRDCDIVLVPAEGIGNGGLLPAGPLREPPSALARADILVRTGEGRIQPLDGIPSAIREWRWRARPEKPTRIAGPAAPPPREALAACAIARPERFVRSLDGLGLRAVETAWFPDHHRFRPAEARRLAASPLPVIVTAKDAVKLLPIWPEGTPLWMLPLTGEGEEGLPDAIVATMLSRRRAPLRRDQSS